jgi:hypothetical protein
MSTVAIENSSASVHFGGGAMLHQPNRRNEMATFEKVSATFVSVAAQLLVVATVLI